MKYYKKGKELAAEFRAKKLEEYYGEEVEILDHRNRPEIYKDLDSAFALNGKEVIFIAGVPNDMGKSASNTDSPENKGVWVYLSKSKGFPTTLFLLSAFTKSKNTTISLIKEIGVNVVPEDMWNNAKFSEQKVLPMFLDKQETGLIFKPASKNKQGIQPKQSFNMLPVIKEWANVNGKTLVVENFDHRLIEGQAGPSNVVMELTKELLSGDEVIIEVEVPQTESALVDDLTSDNQKVDIPELEYNQRVSSEVGTTNVNNKHQIMVAELHNELVDEFGKNAIIKNDGLKDSLHIDNFVIYKQDDVVKAKIYEVKSFASNAYLKAFGQLCMYRNRVSKKFGIELENIDLILVTVDTEIKLSKDFKDILEEQNIKRLKK